jgi:hypothetical protein
MKKAIFTAQKALDNHTKNYVGFMNHSMRIKQRDENLNPLQSPTPQTPTEVLDALMVQSGLSTSLSAKLALAGKLGVHNYTGTPTQDNILISGLQSQTTGKQAEEAKKSEETRTNTDNEFKNRELTLKEKQLEMQKAPTADEIAQSLMSNLK